MRCYRSTLFLYEAALPVRSSLRDPCMKTRYRNLATRLDKKSNIIGHLRLFPYQCNRRIANPLCMDRRKFRDAWRDRRVTARSSPRLCFLPFRLAGLARV
jgi:hypothetical protein